MNDFTEQFLSTGTHSGESTLANEVAYTQLTSSYANPSTSSKYRFENLSSKKTK